MARATRSTTSHTERHEEEYQETSGTPPPLAPSNTKPAKGVNKKRKRMAGTDSDDLPSSKQPKTTTATEEEAHPEKAEDVQTEESGYLPLVGDLPMTDEDARKILEILEMADTQGLLDRVFPLDDAALLKPSSSPSSSKTTPDSYSLRTLLNESKNYPLRVFRSVVRQLYPISSQPRGRISPPAAQQFQFCRLALSLIEQASRRNIDGLSLKPEHILPVKAAEEEEENGVCTTRSKYALVQRLPTGDLWTSLGSDLVGSDAKPLSQLGTGHAELVAILPSASSSEPIPTLGDLHAGKKIQTRYKPPTTRHVSCGAFLDYGPYASFAPVFDNDGADVGRMGVSNVLWRRHEKWKAREKARILGDRLRAKLAARAAERMEVDGIVEVEPSEMEGNNLKEETEKTRALLGKLFAPEESESLEKVVDALECEENVSELLLHNARALARLQELQKERLHGENGGSKGVEVESEEWNLAQMIMDSLAMLASLRPRGPNGAASAIVPPESVLRVLQQTLPCSPSQGWYGTLSESQGFAVRDDTTIRMKGPIESLPSTAAPAPAAPSSTSAAQTPTPSYSTNYTYAAFSQHYRAGPAQNQSYYATTYQQTPQSQKVQVPYQSQYGSSSQYTYGSWLPGQNAGSTVGTPTPGSRRGTPQPTAGHAASSALSSSAYLPYSSALAATTATTPARAVANTVAKPQTNGWPTASMTLPGTPNPGPAGSYALPPHLRPSGGVTPLTGVGAQSYLSGYQATPPANT